MAIVTKTVVRETYETWYEEAKNRLANLDAEIEAKVDEYRKKAVEEAQEEKERLENVIALCTKEVTENVPDEIVETAEEQQEGVE